MWRWVALEQLLFDNFDIWDFFSLFHSKSFQ